MASDALSDGTPSAKQLVFLFMAATVVAVVVFLCGVLVGRGVPFRFVGDTTAFGSGSNVVLDGGLMAVDSGRPSEPPTNVGDDLSYYIRLENDTPAVETLRVGREPEQSRVESVDQVAINDGSLPVPAKLFDPSGNNDVTAEPSDVRQPVSETIPGLSTLSNFEREPRPNMAEAAGSSNRRTGDFTVQVAAYREQSTAHQLTDRLIAMGFPAYVVGPRLDAPVAVYRVRVGSYQDRQEAEQIRLRLKLEEQFNPWITR